MIVRALDVGNLQGWRAGSFMGIFILRGSRGACQLPDRAMGSRCVTEGREIGELGRLVIGMLRFVIGNLQFVIGESDRVGQRRSPDRSIRALT